MKKKLLGILFCGILLLCLTGCGKLNEKELIDTKWYNDELAENEEIFRPIIEFKKVNLMNRCDEKDENCITYIWRIEDGYISVYYSDANQ